jgi:hypothetical protein
MNNLLSTTFKADSDLSTKQYFLGKRTATGVDLAAANDRVLGPIVNKPKQAGGAAIQVAGIAFVKAGAAITAGDYLKADANGRAITAGGEAPGTLVEAFGIALEDATALDDQIRVLLQRVVINRAVS